MQQIFLQWSKYDNKVISDKYVDLFDSKIIGSFHNGIEKRYDNKSLIERINNNVATLENIASEIFRLMSSYIYNTSEEIKVNPYKMSLLNKPVDDIDGLERDEKIKQDVKTMWLY